MKKYIYSLICSFVLTISIILLLIVSPFALSYETNNNAIYSTLKFINEFINIDVENSNIEDIDIYINQICSEEKYSVMLDAVVKDYSITTVTPENLMKVFIYSECKDINEKNIKIIAEYLNKNMKNSIDYEKFTDFIVSTEPFSSSCEKANKDKNILLFLFNYKDADDNDLNIDSNSPVGTKIVEYAKSRLKCRYYWGASGPTYFDCSGLVYWCYNQAGIKINRTTSSGYSKMGKSISYSQLQKGDIITFSYGAGVEHIGIYIGEGQMINALGSGSGTKGQYANQCVKISSVTKGSYFYKRIYNCRRLY